MSKPFTMDKVRVVYGPRSYVNKELGEDIRLHTIQLVWIGDTIATFHARLNTLVICTDEDVPLG